MSADALALVVRAATEYAKVRGPLIHCTTMVLEPDPTRPSWLIVRDSHPARTREALLFNPLPRKEMPMPESPLAEAMNRLLPDAPLEGHDPLSGMALASLLLALLRDLEGAFRGAAELLEARMQEAGS